MLLMHHKVTLHDDDDDDDAIYMQFAGLCSAIFNLAKMPNETVSSRTKKRGNWEKKATIFVDAFLLLSPEALKHKEGSA